MASTRKPYNDRAGYIASLRSGYNRGWVVIYDGVKQGIPVEDGGRYAVVCETHATIQQTTSLPSARSAMKDPAEWCECCNGRCGLVACSEQPHPPHTKDKRWVAQ